VNFGSAGILREHDAQGTLSIQCSSSLPYTVSLNGGNSGATDPTQRKRASRRERDLRPVSGPARSLPWGSTIGTNTTSGTAAVSRRRRPSHGRIAAQTTPKPGTYTDSVIATVGY